MFPIRIIHKKTNIDFVAKRWIALFLSGLLTLATIFCIATKGFNFGIDFAGGIVMEVRTDKVIDLADLRNILNEAKIGDVSLQNFGTDKNDIMIRIGQNKVSDANQMNTVNKVKELLTQKIPVNIEYRKTDYVGPQVGGELVKSGLIALVLAILSIVIYVGFRFEWQFGVGAVLALIHDAVMTLGLYSFTGLEFNLTSVAAVLTIIGYSVNDTVVIYDRIRENLRKYKKMPLNNFINQSMNETLSRTILVSRTTFVSVFALAMVGGEVIKGFSYAMMFGIFVGTYSSIYIATPVLIFFNLRGERNSKQETLEQQA